MNEPSPLRVFLSHSSHEEGSLERLCELAAALETGPNRVEVLVDREQIEEGTRWRKMIDGMLTECEAAVILITEDALESPWVLAEATLLRARYDRETRPQFPLLPVVVDVGENELKTHRLWHPVALDEIQYVENTAPSALAERIKARLAQHAPARRSPMDRIVKDIVGVLSNATLNLPLDDVAQALGPVPLRVSGAAERFAYAIARWMIAQQPPALMAVADQMLDLGEGFPPEDAHRILQRLVPLWVEVPAASTLLRPAWNRPECRSVALVCRHPDPTLEHYVTRAHMPRRQPKPLVLNNVTGGDQFEDIARQLRDAARGRFPEMADTAADDDELDNRLATTSAPITVALELPDDDEVVEELQSRYRALTFIFFLRGTGGAARRRVSGVEWVEPPHSLDLERQVLEDRGDAFAAFR
jgi:hypothetical protein